MVAKTNLLKHNNLYFIQLLYVIYFHITVAKTNLLKSILSRKRAMLLKGNTALNHNKLYKENTPTIKKASSVYTYTVTLKT